MLKRKLEKPLKSIIKKSALIVPPALIADIATSAQVISSVKKYQSPKELTDLPHKVLKQIISYLSQHDQAQLARTMNRIHNIVVPILYQVPRFTSLRQFYNFATVVSGDATRRRILAFYLEKLSLRHIVERSVPEYANQMNAALETVCRSCKNISVLDLHSFAYLADSTMQIITAELRTGLLDVDLSGCIYATGVSILALTFHCPKVKSLDASNGLKVLNSSLWAMADKWTSSLQFLNLTGCVAIDRSGLKVLAESCHALKEVILKSVDVEFFEIGSNANWVSEWEMKVKLVK